MLSLGNQNQFPSSLVPLGDLLKVIMFLSNLNGFNFPPHLGIKGSQKGKVHPPIPKCGRKKAQSDSVSFSLSLPLCSCITCLFCFLVVLSQSSLYSLYVSFFHVFVLFIFSFVLFYFT